MRRSSRPSANGRTVSLDSTLGQHFEAELLPGEKLLWTGRPEPSVLFTPMDLFLVPFSLLWGGGVISIFVVGLMDDTGDPIFQIISTLFAMMGLYLIVGRFLVKRWAKNRTFYAVTDRRVVSLRKGFSRSVHAAFLHSIPSVAKRERRSGIGTLIFERGGWMASWYANTGLEAFGSFYGSAPLAFYDIRDAGHVYTLVNQLRASFSPPR
jgi:hypothetical protein